MVVYVPEKVHRMLKTAAATRGMSLSKYVLARIMAPGPVVVTGDIVAAPRETDGT